MSRAIAVSRSRFLLSFALARGSYGFKRPHARRDGVVFHPSCLVWRNRHERVAVLPRADLTLNAVHVSPSELPPFPLMKAALWIAGDQHEHLGQLITYARSVGVVPPWSK